MTVGELIEELQKYDPDLQALCYGPYPYGDIQPANDVYWLSGGGYIGTDVGVVVSYDHDKHLAESQENKDQ